MYWYHIHIHCSHIIFVEPEAIVEEDDGKKKKKKRVVDPDRPKRTPSGYQLFMSVKTSEIQKNNPTQKQTEVMSEIGKLWSTIKPDEKRVYLEKAAGLKVDYDERIKEYEAGLKVSYSPIL